MKSAKYRGNGWLISANMHADVFFSLVFTTTDYQSLYLDGVILRSFIHAFVITIERTAVDSELKRPDFHTDA